MRQVPMPKTGISAPEGSLQERIRNFRDCNARPLAYLKSPCRTPHRAARSRASAARHRRKSLRSEALPQRARTLRQPGPAGQWRLLARPRAQLRRRDRNEAVREAIEELIEETPESDTPISDDQRESCSPTS